MAYPESFIEKGRRSLQEKEQRANTCEVIFNSAINLLGSNGYPFRESILLKYQCLTHTVNSQEPPVTVTLMAGANLRKARSVWMFIEGLDRGLRVDKRKVRDGKETYSGETRRSGYGRDLGLTEALGYLKAIEQLSTELSQQQAS